MRNPTKQHQRANQTAIEVKEKALENQLQMDGNDARKIENILSTLLDLDARKAREIIKSTAFRYLIQPRQADSMDRKNSLKCPLALHAIVLALSTTDEDITAILNEMYDFEINSLKECIAIAQKTTCPSKDFVIGLATDYQNKLKTPLSPNERVDISRKLKSITVTANVIDLWDDAVNELSKWASAISTFNRKPKVVEESQVEPQKDKGASKLELGIRETNLTNRTKNCLLGAGIDTIGKLTKKTKDELYKIHRFGRRSMSEIELLLENMDLKLTSPKPEKPDLSKIKIENLRSLYCAKNPLLAAGIDTIDKLSKMTEQDLRKIHGVGQMAIQHIDTTLKSFGLDLIKATPAKKKRQVRKTTSVVIIPDEPGTLLDLKATETTATAIIRLIEIANQYNAKSAELVAAQAELTTVKKEMLDETDTDKTDELLVKIKSQNDVVKLKQADVAASARAKELLEQKQSAQVAKDNAEQAAIAANKKLNDVFVNIATFLESLKQNAK